MKFAKAIREAKTESEAIAFYGRFVERYESLNASAKKASKRDKGWNRRSVEFSRFKNQIPSVQQALLDLGILSEAAAEHPFS